MANYTIPGYEGEVKGHALTSKHGSLTAWGITEFLNKEVRDITAPNRLTNKNYLQSSIERLTTLREHFKKEEQKAYDKLGVKGGLAELQQEIKKINGSGLINLSNAALKRMPLIKGMAGPSTKEMEKMIGEEFKQWIINKKGPEGVLFNRQINSLAEKKVEEAFETYLLGKIRKESGKGIRPPESFLTGVRTGEKTHRLTGVKLNKKMLRKYKNEIGLAFDWKDTNDGMEVKVEVSLEEPVSYKLNYYPYYLWQDYTTEEQKELLENKEIWERFKKQVANCCPDYSDVIKQQMEAMKVENFATAATSQQDVIGIFGELQTMVILAILCPGTKPSFLGHEKIDGKKIGVDVALEAVGFQVKNYNMYGERGTDQGIHLRGDYTLNNFLSKLNGAFGSDQIDVLRNYYAITVYHLQATKAFQRVIRRYKPINTKLDSLYHGAIDNFLPLQEITVNIENEAQRDVQNLFYLIGGERIVPVSKIINLYIIYLERLKEKIRETRLFTTKRHYHGQTYIDEHDATKKGEPYTFVGYDDITKNTRVSYNINLNIDYTIKEMLSKLDDSDFFDF